MTRHDLTAGMKTALLELHRNLKFVDVRSGAALHRRGLARYEPDRRGGHYAAAYYPTEQGRALATKILAARQAVLVGRLCRLLRAGSIDQEATAVIVTMRDSDTRQSLAQTLAKLKEWHRWEA